MSTKKQILERLDKYKLEIQRRKDQLILTEYMPRSFHWEFLTNWVEKGTKKNFFIGSNQSGKTTVGCIIIRAFALGYHTWIKSYADYIEKNWGKLKYPISGHWIQDEFDNVQSAKNYVMGFEDIGFTPPTRYAVVAKDFKAGVGKVLEPKLKELVPGPYKDGKYVKNIERLQGKTAETIHWQNGSSTHFFSGEQDTFRFEGGTWDGIGWDEPPKQEHYVAMDRGTLVNDAPMFFHLTPVSEPWIYDTLLQDAKKPGSKVHLSTCDLFSPEVDWMTEEKKTDFKREVEREDPHQVQARVYGKFTHLLGRIFPTYSEDIHLVPHSETTPYLTHSQTALSHNVTYGVTIDPHDRRPFMIGFWFVNADNDITFFKNYPIDPMPEIKSCDLTVKNYADMIKEVQNSLPGQKLTYFFIDPNKAKTPRKTLHHAGQTLLDDFAQEGLFFDAEINDSHTDGHTIVRDYLWVDPDKEVSYMNKPKLKISDECWNLNTSMLRYTWNEKKSKELASEVVHEKWKDGADIIRYTCVKHPVWIKDGADQVWTPPVRGSIYG